MDTYAIYHRNELILSTRDHRQAGVAACQTSQYRGGCVVLTYREGKMVSRTPYKFTSRGVAYARGVGRRN